MKRDDDIDIDIDIDGELLLALVDPIEPSAALQVALLGAVQESAWWAPFARRVASLCDVSHGAARALLATLDDESRWQEGPADGVRLFHIDAGPRLIGAIAGFVRIDPGAAFPAHTHLGPEEVLVLRGSFVNEDGGVVAVGAEAPRPAGSRHEVRAGPEGCLYLGIVDTGMEFAPGVVIGPDDPRA